MQKTLRRIVSILLMIAMVLGMVPETGLSGLFRPKALAGSSGSIPEAFSLAASKLGAEQEAGPWRYALRNDDGFAVITGYSGDETSVSVPLSLNGVDVVGLAGGALVGREEVTLPVNIYFITEDAFGTDGFPEIVSPNGSYGLWWANAHGLKYRTGKEYDLVPGVIDYSGLDSERIQKRGDEYVAFGKTESLPLTIGTVFFMRDRHGMDFFLRVTGLSEDGGKTIAAVEIPDVADAIINYETTVEIHLGEEDFVPAEGVIVGGGKGADSKTIARPTESKKATFTKEISGVTKEFGKNDSSSFDFSGSVSVTTENTVTYTIRIDNGEITKAEMTRIDDTEGTVSVMVAVAENLIKQYSALENQLTKDPDKADRTLAQKIEKLLGRPFITDEGSVSYNEEDYRKALSTYLKDIGLKKEETLNKATTNGKWEFGKFRFQTPYFNISFAFSAEIEIAGSVSYTTRNSTVTKQHYDFDTDDWVVDYSNGNTAKKESSRELEIEVKGTFSLGVEVAVGAFFFKNFSARLTAGVEFSFSKTIEFDGWGSDYLIHPQCSLFTIKPFITVDIYAGLWVAGSTGAKLRLYHKEFTPHELIGKPYLVQMHINLALDKDKAHDPDNCPYDQVKTVHYETNSTIQVQDKKILTGDPLTDRYNVDLNQNQTVQSDKWKGGRFLGWAWSPEDTDPTAAEPGEAFKNPEGNLPVTVNANLTLYAIWETCATVSFDSMGGSEVPDQVVPIGGYVRMPDPPEKAGAYFGAWMTAENLPWEFEHYTVSKDITLHADWSSSEPSAEGGSRTWAFIGKYEDVSESCIIDPARQGQTGSNYLNCSPLYLGDSNEILGVQITGVKNNPVNLVIPKKMWYSGKEYNVIDTSYNAFRDCESLKSVYFLSEYDEFSNLNFSGCTNLEYVELPGLQDGKINDNMFYECENLKCVRLRPGVKTIGTFAFMKTGIRSAILPEGLTAIQDRAFAWCTSLETVVVPNSVREITVDYVDWLGHCQGPFHNCTSLMEICLGGVETVTKGMLRTGSLMLETVKIWGNVKNIEDGAFNSSKPYQEDYGTQDFIGNGYDHNTSAHTRLIIGEGVKTIGAKAFYACRMFDEISLPSTLESIGQYAFWNCNGLTKLELDGDKVPALKNIPAYMFEYCYGLTSVTLANVETIGYNAFHSCTALTDVAMANVEEIGGNAFSECTSLNYLDLGQHITEIKGYAFSDCKQLEKINVPDSTTRICPYAFFRCTGVTDISVGGVETLEEYALETGSVKLETLTIRGTVKKIDNNALNSNFDYSGSTYVHNNGYNTVVPQHVSLSIEYGVKEIGNYAFYNCRMFDSISIASSVKKCGSSAFEGCHGIKALEIDGMESIGPSAFVYCSSLQTVILKNVGTVGSSAFSGDTEINTVLCENVSVIEDNAFYNCQKLHTLDLGGDVTSIGKSAFDGCRMLENVRIPDSVKTLKKTDYDRYFGPFSNCVQVTNFSVGGVETITSGMLRTGSTSLRKLTIRGSVKAIGNNALDSSVTDGENIGVYDRWCISGYEYQSSGPVELIIDRGVETIGKEAFRRCRAFTFVSLPDTLTSIGQDAFLDCSGIQDMLIASPHLVFDGNPFRNCSNMTVHLAVENPELAALLTSWNIPWDTNQSYPHTLTLVNNNGEADTVMTLNWAEEMILPNPTREGYYFDGWFEDEALTNRWESETMPPNDLTLYAGWKHDPGNMVCRNDGDHMTLLRWLNSDTAVSVAYLPETVDGLPLTAIAAGAFKDSNVHEVYLSQQITAIEAGAFAGSKSLYALRTDSRNSMYRSMDGILYSADGKTLLFAPPKGKTAVSLPEGLIRIEAGAFSDTALASVSLPQTLKEIGSRAFCRTNLQKVTLPAALETIGAAAFEGCGLLDEIRAEGNPADVAETAFNLCYPFLLAYGPDEDCPFRTVIRSEGYLYNAYTLTVVQPAKTTTAFLPAGNDLLLPLSPAMPENYQFTGWYTDEQATQPFTETVMPAHDLTLYAGREQIFEYTVADESITIVVCHASGHEAVIPFAIGGVTVTEIGSGAFGEQYTRVTVPETVTWICDGAFPAGCELVCVPGSFAAEWADTHGFTVAERTVVLSFETGFGLEIEPEERIPETPVNPPEIFRSGYAFDAWYYDENCETPLEENALMPDENLTIYAGWIVVDETVAYTADHLEWVLDEETGKIRITGYSGTAENLSIPSELHSYEVKEIADSAFAYCESIRTLTIPDSVTAIGARAFYAMRNLTSLTLSAEADDLPMKAFAECVSLAELVIPEGVKVIRNNAFENAGLTNVSLPASLNSVYPKAFLGCTSLAQITVAAGNPYYEARDGVLYDTDDRILVKYPAARQGTSYTVSTNIYTIGPYAFENAVQLTSVSIGNTYTLGEGAFRGCTGLTQIPELSARVTKIPEVCFLGCTGLGEVTIPQSVKQIKERAFARSGITDAFIPESVVSIGKDAWEKKTVLHGTAGSYAQTWAVRNGYTFIPVNAVLPEAICFSEESLCISRGNHCRLSVTAVPSNADISGIMFVSDNPQAVWVSDDGTLYALSKGSAVITAFTPGGVFAVCTVRVKVDVNAVKLRDGILTWKMLNSSFFWVGISPDDATEDPALTWTSSNEQVLKVNQDGTFIGLRPGSAVVRATTYNGVYGEREVVVSRYDKCLVLPASLTEVEPQAFMNSTMEQIIFREQITAIGSKAFANSAGLKVVEIPVASVSIAGDAFDGCTAVKIFAPAGGSVEAFAGAANIPFVPMPD